MGDAERDEVRVGHVIAWLSASGYGVWEVVWSLARHARSAGVRAAIAGCVDDSTDRDVASDSGVELIRATASVPRSFARSRDLARKLVAYEPEVIHNHGMWLLSGRSAREASERLGVPMVCSPHGMLEPWARNSRRWKKDLAWWGWERANYAHAACLHTTAAPEARTLRARGFDHPIAVVPLGVDLGLYSCEPERELLGRVGVGGAGGSGGDGGGGLGVLADVPFILCMGRLNPVKGVMHLAEAWSGLSRAFPEWHLVFAGPDQDGYQAEVERRLESDGTRDRVHFPGTVGGELKRALLSSASLYVQPSEQENFGLTIAESLASGVPVVTTTGTPWVELEDLDCGRRVAPSGEAIASACEALMSLGEGERRAMGARGRALVERKYTWPAVSSAMGEVYRWLAGGMASDGVPACVVEAGEAVGNGV